MLLILLLLLTFTDFQLSGQNIETDFQLSGQNIETEAISLNN